MFGSWQDSRPAYGKLKTILRSPNEIPQANVRYLISTEKLKKQDAESKVYDKMAKIFEKISKGTLVFYIKKNYFL